MVERDIIAHIGSQAEQRVNSYPSGPSKVIAKRLQDLDVLREKRTLRDSGCTLAILSLAVASVLRKRHTIRATGIALTGMAAGAVWLRNRIARSRSTVDREKLALRIIRGDFDGIHDEWSRRACAMQLLRE